MGTERSCLVILSVSEESHALDAEILSETKDDKAVGGAYMPASPIYWPGVRAGRPLQDDRFRSLKSIISFSDPDNTTAAQKESKDVSKLI